MFRKHRLIGCLFFIAILFILTIGCINVDKTVNLESTTNVTTVIKKVDLLILQFGQC